MAAKRLLGAAAVCASAVRAGTMDSSKGKATTTPALLSIVRLEMFFLVMNMIRLSL